MNLNDKYKAAHQATRSLVLGILKNPYDRDWVVNGMGFLRTDIVSGCRLHLWNRALSYQEVSTIHNHPWHFESYVVAGTLLNIKYIQVAERGRNMMGQKILCGKDACTVGEPFETKLSLVNRRHYFSGDTYTQQANEIHEVEVQTGTMTIVSQLFTDDPDHALVFWEQGKEWVTAKPRTATKEEIDATIALCLNVWNDG